MNINLRILLLKTFASEGSSRSRTAMAFVRHREKPSPREMVNREAQTSEKLQFVCFCFVFFEGPNEVDLMRRSSSRDNANQRWTQRLLHFGPRTNTQPTFHFSVFDSRNILKLVFFFFFYPKEICTGEKNQNEYLGTKSRKSDPKKKAFLCILWAKRTRRRRRTRKMFCKQMHTCLPLSLRSQTFFFSFFFPKKSL